MAFTALLAGSIGAYAAQQKWSTSSVDSRQMFLLIVTSASSPTFGLTPPATALVSLAGSYLSF